MKWITVGSVIKTKYTENPIMARVIKKWESCVGIAGFDLDQTLITPKSRKTHPLTPDDFQILSGVKKTLTEYSKTHIIVIFTNQNGISCGYNDAKFYKDRLEAVLYELGLENSALVYIATERDNYRKPEPGMFQELEKDLKEQGISVDKSRSFFCGNSAGRPKDMNSSDKFFARNAGIAFMTPEECFCK